MARGSEQIRRSWLRGQTVFKCCGEPIRRLADVGEVKNLFTESVYLGTEVYCMACRGKR